MEEKSRLKTLIDDINTILDTQMGNTKTETLARQRGYLTGWLARLGVENWEIQQEIKARLKQSSDKQ